MPAIILFAVWKNFGYNMIIFLAGLQSIPRSCTRRRASTARRRWQQFRHVTLPMLAPTLLLVSILTMAGYFQLFAEPYVMTQGGPLQSTVSVLYFMYEEGFKWWNLGSASAVAFLLFVLDLRGDRACSCGWRGGRGLAMNAAGSRAPAVNGLLLGHRGRSRSFPLLWMVSVSLMAPGEASTFPAAAAAAAAPTLENYRELFAHAGMGRYLLNSVLLDGAAHAAARCSSTSLAGYAFAKLRFAGRDRIFRLLLGALVIPAQVAMLPLFLLLKQLGLVNTLRGRDRAGAGQHLRHLPRAAVRAVDPRRPARGGAHRRRERVPHLPLDRRAGAEADPRHARDLHVPRHLERLHVAADRADRRGPATRCRSRWPACRASTCRTTS